MKREVKADKAREEEIKEREEIRERESGRWNRGCWIW
jgi:hypothetical protein